MWAAVAMMIFGVGCTELPYLHPGTRPDRLADVRIMSKNQFQTGNAGKTQKLPGT